MVVDYKHMSSFQWKDPNFMDNLLLYFNRFEVYLRAAATSHLINLCEYQIGKGKFILLSIFNLPSIGKIRDLKTGSLGKIMSIQGTVTRTTEVKPELFVGTFKCKLCNATVGPIEQQYKYTEPLRCSNTQCQNMVQWELIMSQSIFVDWQKIRV